MVGLFKAWKNNEVTFYELETITVDSSGLALNVKHFNADLSGWEEKDKYERFAFVSAGKDEVVFKGLTYRKLSADTIKIILDMKKKDGSIHQIEIVMNKTEL